MYPDNIMEDQVWGSYFRICVTILVNQYLLSDIKLVIDVGSWKQKIVREDQLDLCPMCKLVDHGKGTCVSLVTMVGLNKYV